MTEQHELRIGTSGWSYDHWQGVFYPEGLPADRWFGHYAEHFDTVEINNTFYQLPEERIFESWRQQAPAGFLYAVKANRYLTHMKKLNEPEEPLERFLSRARLLGHKLGPILYQLPPNWHRDVDRLGRFIDLLPADLTHVFEFRDETWFSDETFDLLRKQGMGFCIFDGLKLVCPRQVTGPTVYLRFHGTSAEYGGKYTREMLAKWAEQIRGWYAEGRDVYAYFNNDPHGYAVENAQALRELVGR